jgi:hypothetical protein
MTLLIMQINIIQYITIGENFPDQAVQPPVAFEIGAGSEAGA